MAKTSASICCSTSSWAGGIAVPGDNFACASRVSIASTSAAVACNNGEALSILATASRFSFFAFLFCVNAVRSEITVSRTFGSDKSLPIDLFTAAICILLTPAFLKSSPLSTEVALSGNISGWGSCMAKPRSTIRSVIGSLNTTISRTSSSVKPSPKLAFFTWFNSASLAKYSSWLLATNPSLKVSGKLPTGSKYGSFNWGAASRSCCSGPVSCSVGPVGWGESGPVRRSLSSVGGVSSVGVGVLSEPPVSPLIVPPAIPPRMALSIIRSTSAVPNASGLSSINRSAAMLMDSCIPSVTASVPSPDNSPAVIPRSLPAGIPARSSSLAVTPTFIGPINLRATAAGSTESNAAAAVPKTRAVPGAISPVSW